MYTGASCKGLGLVQGTSTLHTKLARGNCGCSQLGFSEAHGHLHLTVISPPGSPPPLDPYQTPSWCFRSSSEAHGHLHLTVISPPGATATPSRPVPDPLLVLRLMGVDT
eukprot:3231144-Pyramimonas_sp.AAC.1